MALNIKDPETDRKVRELAALTGQGITEAISEAVSEKIQKLRSMRKGAAGAGLADELMAIGKRCAALPVDDPRPADEILGYDDSGALN